MASLQEIVFHLADYPREWTIYASKPWSPDSIAVVAREPDDGGLPSEANGLTYLLEVWLAQEAISVWSQWRGGVEPTTDERVKAIIHYSLNDAYLPV